MKSTINVDCDTMHCACPKMMRVFQDVERVAAHDVTVLLTGETGTGKELVARAIHQNSDRSNQPFISEKCAVVEDVLFESGLYRNEQTGAASARRQKHEESEKPMEGTLFLDEVADLSQAMQAKLVHLIEQKQIERESDNELECTPVRLISATNCDLHQMTADGSFREDLYYRLVEFQISLPPLRERANDVDLLVSHFVERFSRVLEHDVRGIAPEALDLMKQYSWPGNVRELQSAIKHALVRTDGPLVNPESLPESIREERSTPADRFSASEKTNSANFGDWDCFIADKLRSGTDDLYAESMSLIDRHLLKHVLRHTRGNQLQAARVLGISRGTLRTKIHVLNIKTETER